jgi:hypothetical protein
MGPLTPSPGGVCLRLVVVVAIPGGLESFSIVGGGESLVGGTVDVAWPPSAGGVQLGRFNVQASGCSLRVADSGENPNLRPKVLGFLRQCLVTLYT